MTAAAPLSVSSRLMRVRDSATVDCVSDTIEESNQSLDPVQGVLEILSRASMTGTNKLGLLLALLDLAPETLRDNRPIAKNELATRYLDLHWEHGRPYGELVLRQSSAKKSRSDETIADDTTVMQKVHELRHLLQEMAHGDFQSQPLEVVRHKIGNTPNNDEWDDALNKSIAQIEKDLWRNPVDKLQNLPGNPGRFLFEHDRREIRFLDGVAEQLTRFSGVLRPLVQFQFAELVARINRENLNAPDHDIHQHLFGQDRIMPPSDIRSGLVELQGRKCIFTGRQLRRSYISLDHVIPWSRIRLSHVENFVMTTKSTNSSKADSLLGPNLIDRWLKHLDGKSQEIELLAAEHNWPTDPDRVRRAALQIYEVLDPAVGVWQGDGGVQPLGDQGKAEVVSMLSG